MHLASELLMYSFHLVYSIVRCPNWLDGFEAVEEFRWKSWKIAGIDFLLTWMKSINEVIHFGFESGVMCTCPHFSRCAHVMSCNNRLQIYNLVIRLQKIRSKSSIFSLTNKVSAYFNFRPFPPTVGNSRSIQTSLLSEAPNQAINV